MDIEIDHGDALEAMHTARMHRRDRDIVEEAKAHRMMRLGVMPRRTHRAERVLRLAFITASTAAIQAPAARSAASPEPGESTVSASIAA